MVKLTILKINRTVKLGLILIIFFSVGCASSSRNLIPLSDNGSTDPKLQSSFKSEDGVKVVVRASAWSGSPDNIERYVTPFHLEIQNSSDKTLDFDYDDLALFDENRTQYNALPPQTVADVLQSGFRGGYGYRSFYPSFSLGIGSGFFFGRRAFFSPFGFGRYGFSPFWYPPAYSYRPPDTEDIFTQALIPGSVQPNAKLEGFVYFKMVPDEVERVTLEVGYEVQGEQERHRLSFPFAVQKSS